MLILSIIIIPIAGIILLLLGFTDNNFSNKIIQYENYKLQNEITEANSKTSKEMVQEIKKKDTKMKTLGLTITVINFFVSYMLLITS